MRFILALLLILVVFPMHVRAADRKYVYPPQRFSLKGVRAIQIVGVKGTLKLRGRKGPFVTLRVQHSRAAEDWNLSLDRRGDTLYLEVANVTYGKAWQKQVRQDQWPEFDIELDSPPRPATVSWREGHVAVEHWDANLEISFLKGQTEVTGGRGSLKLEQVEATTRVRNRQGPVTIHGESGRLSLNKIRGDLQVSWLKGNLLLKDCRGTLQIEARDGDVTVEGGRGELALTLPDGHARLAGFQGLVNAKGVRSKWDVTAGAPSDLSITTDSGPVHLAWTGGAKAFLSSTQGPIAAPKWLQSESGQEGPQVVRGIKAGSARGQVFVRTTSGAIRWR